MLDIVSALAGGLVALASGLVALVAAFKALVYLYDRYRNRRYLRCWRMTFKRDGDVAAIHLVVESHGLEDESLHPIVKMQAIDEKQNYVALSFKINEDERKLSPRTSREFVATVNARDVSKHLWFPTFSFRTVTNLRTRFCATHVADIESAPVSCLGTFFRRLAFKVLGPITLP